MEIIQEYRVDEIVYQKLLKNIRERVWRNGEQIPSEGELCKLYHVSRVSIRSAIQRLKGMGLIKTLRGKGSFVCSSEVLYDFSQFKEDIQLTVNDAIEISDLREALESQSAEILINRQGPVDLEQMCNALAGMRNAIESMDYLQYSQNDYAFHLGLVLATQNARFAQIMQIFHHEIYHYILQMNKFILLHPDDVASVKERFKESLASHETMLQAIMDHDSQGSNQITHKIITSNVERFLAYLDEKKIASSNSHVNQTEADIMTTFKDFSGLSQAEKS